MLMYFSRHTATISKLTYVEDNPFLYDHISHFAIELYKELFVIFIDLYI